MPEEFDDMPERTLERFADRIDRAVETIRAELSPIRRDVGELKEGFARLDERVSAVADVRRIIDDHEKRLRKVEEEGATGRGRDRLIGWGGSLVFGALAAWIVRAFTGN